MSFALAQRHPGGLLYPQAMRGLFALFAILAVVFGPVAAGARVCAQIGATVASAPSAAMHGHSASPIAGMGPCAEHMAKKAADAKCARACAATVSVAANVNGSDLSAPAELGMADMAMTTDLSPRSVAAPLLERPPKLSA